MTEDFERVVSRVRERVDPDPDERERLQAATAALTERAESAVANHCPDADVLLVGSTARDTWISGDRDIDIFVRFPPTVDEDTLEEIGLVVGHATLPDGREEYADHPYVTGRHDGFAVDVVPCYRVDSATEIRSAVDRTPFHTQYLRRRLDDDLAAAVRVTKQFMTAIGVYGSDLRTRGYSGYLTELLVCEHGGFRPLLEAVADWRPPVRLDPESHGEDSFDDPLVVIDPTDPNRNVAAVCSRANVARLQHYARDLLDDPRTALFERKERRPLSKTALTAHLDRRGTTPIAIRFDAPRLVDDQLYPQLRKSLDGITAALDDRGFDVLRSTTFADETAVVFLELTTPTRPAVEEHLGPPIHVRSHAVGFYETYADDETVYGPFVEGDRYVIERPREFRSAMAFLESDQLFTVGLGAHIETALEEDYDVLVGDDITALCDEFATELRRYFDPTP